MYTVGPLPFPGNCLPKALVVVELRCSVASRPGLNISKSFFFLVVVSETVAPQTTQHSVQK